LLGLLSPKQVFVKSRAARLSACTTHRCPRVCVSSPRIAFRALRTNALALATRDRQPTLRAIRNLPTGSRWLSACKWSALETHAEGDAQIREPPRDLPNGHGLDRDWILARPIGIQLEREISGVAQGVAALHATDEGQCGQSA
jgi:hypothetical protein